SRSDSKHSLNALPVRLAVGLDRFARERPEKLREAHQGMETEAAIVARPEAVAVDDHVGAGVDSSGPQPLPQAAEMRPIARSEAGRPRRLDVELAVPGSRVDCAVSRPHERGELSADRQNRLEALAAVRGHRDRIRWTRQQTQVDRLLIDGIDGEDPWLRSSLPCDDGGCPAARSTEVRAGEETGAGGRDGRGVDGAPLRACDLDAG